MKYAICTACLVLTMAMPLHALEITGAELSFSNLFTPEDDDPDTYEEIAARITAGEGAFSFQLDAVFGIYDGDTTSRSYVAHAGYAFTPELTLGGYYALERWDSSDYFGNAGVEATYRTGRLSLDLFAGKSWMYDTPLHGIEFGGTVEYEIWDRTTVYASYMQDKLLNFDDVTEAATLGLRYRATDALSVGFSVSEYYYDGSLASDETQIGLSLRYTLDNGASFGPRTWQSYIRD